MVTLTGLCLNAAEERQITASPRNHDMDNNDNFSPDGRFLVYDTRESIGVGIDNSQSIEMVEVDTGKETVLYHPKVSVTGSRPAPGVGAASFSGASNDIAFIHGPPVAEMAVRGPYDKPNRNGAHVIGDPAVQPKDGEYPMSWLDKRDVATDRPTLPGAHRGGTHRHEYTLDGSRIGFTYNDFLLPQYGRTVGYMVPSPKAPAPASHYFAVLVPIVPKGTAKPGEIEIAQSDSWVGREGAMRAFIGTVKEEDGSYQDSLFVIDVPRTVDITTADSGSATSYPKPPAGVSIRRLTHDAASGVVRGTADGTRIAYSAKAPDGTKQLFVIASDGSDRAEDPAKRPAQLSHFPKGVDAFWRWNSSGDTLFCLSNGAVAMLCAQPGSRFGETTILVPEDGAARKNLVLSPDGKRLALNKPCPANGADGKPAKDYAGRDFLQIFVVNVPETPPQ